MLRRLLIGAGVAMLGWAAWLWLGGAHSGSLAALVAWGVILAGGIGLERYRYKPELDRPPGPDWVPTGERSDGADGTVTVWYHPGRGERAYVRDSAK